MHCGISKRRGEREREREGHETKVQSQGMFYIAPKRRRNLALLLPLKEEKEGEEWVPLAVMGSLLPPVTPGLGCSGQCQTRQRNSAWASSFSSLSLTGHDPGCFVPTGKWGYALFFLCSSPGASAISCLAPRSGRDMGKCQIMSQLSHLSDGAREGGSYICSFIHQ